MELFNQHTRCNGSYSSLNKNVGSSMNFYDVISTQQAHYVVFNTRNVTKSLSEITEQPSNIAALKPKCIISTHGLGGPGPNGCSRPDQFHNTVHLLPLTTCTKHWIASFLPYDCVANLPEYTQATRGAPASKVSHSFYDCILEFPNPPPISSSQEMRFCRDDFFNKCYQCVADLEFPKSVYMYRDYMFCCQSCRFKACVTHYWYKKLMNIEDEDEDEVVKEKKSEPVVHVKDNHGMEGDSIFFIDL